MMAHLEIQSLSKSYDGKRPALAEVGLSAEQGEFIVLVGPSGCGKSTLLRILAGLETPDQGEIRLGGARLDTIPVGNRDLAMVFQDYALYPHLTVAENLAFPLKVQRVPKPERRARVADAAALLGLDGVMDRRPAQLSGGQRQRVAIGRAIVRRPSLFLFDEPLSNLDAQLRTQTRVELAALHRRLGATTVYVTHDQSEAMTLADRLVVLREGRVQQTGAPLELYNQPANRFVASFLGSPSMNFLEGQVSRAGGPVFLVDGWRIDLTGAALPVGLEGPAVLGIRPEAIRLATTGEGLPATVSLVEALGHSSHLYVEAGSARIVLRVEGSPGVARGDAIRLQMNPDAMHWFDAVTGDRLGTKGFSASLASHP